MLRRLKGGGPKANARVKPPSRVALYSRIPPPAPRCAFDVNGLAPASSTLKMATLQRQSSRRSKVDEEGAEVVVPGCFTRGVMRCP